MADEVYITHIAGEVLKTAANRTYMTHVAGEVLRTPLNRTYITHVAGEILIASSMGDDVARKGDMFLVM